MHHTQPPFVRSFVRSFSRAPVRSHGSPLGREGVAGAPHSTIARSLAHQFMSHGSPLGREGSRARHTPPPLARLLANSGLTAHNWGRRVATGEQGDTSVLSGLTAGEGSQAAQKATQKATQVHHTQPPFVRSFVRSFSRSPVRSHGSPLGREGSTRGAILNHRSLPARSLAKFTAIL